MLLFSERRYDPGTIRVMTDALEDAWQATLAKSVYRALDPTHTRRAMATLIMRAVDGGQCDADHLKSVALGAVEAQS